MSELVDGFMEHHPISPVGTTIKPNQLKAVQKEVRSLRTQLAKANERVAELEKFQEEIAYKCFTAGLNTEKPNEPSGENQTATAINHFAVTLDRYAISTTRSILEQLRKEQESDKPYFLPDQYAMKKKIDRLEQQLAKANERTAILEQCVIKFRQGVTHFNRTRGDLNVLLSAYADCEQLHKEQE